MTDSRDQNVHQSIDSIRFFSSQNQAKRAAHDELENNREGNGWDPNNCMLAYETALWMLEGLLDPGEDGRPLPESEVGQVRQCEYLVLMISA